MSRITLAGNPPISVNLRRSARARRISLRISRLDGRVTLTMPTRVDEREGIAFVRERELWLRSHLDKMGEERTVGIDGTVLFRGDEVPVLGTTGKRVRFTGEVLEVPNEPDRAGTRVLAFFKHQARDALAEASDRYAARLGRSYGRLSLRDTRSRWGSCTSAGDLMYSWRLIMAPPEVLDYVAAHEVAHLVEMNHSQAFWDVVADIYPDYEEPRQWLKTKGQVLHRVRFSD